ncbi:MAG: AMP-binding protein, partial [Rhodoblastus sp.]|nr:AMP-binding protein [Rhodoblastus sp.]
MPAHLYAELSSRFPADRSRIAFETQDGALHSYADVEAGSARMAGALIALGVKPGDRVAVQIEKSLQAVLLYLGCARAGAVFLPLNTAYTPAEIEYFLTDAEPIVFVCDPARKDSLAGAAKVAHVETLDADGRGSMSERAR